MTTSHTTDRARIIECILHAAAAFDAHDWHRLRACLTDLVETDYSQFRGEAPEVVSADAYVASRRESLAGLRTLHVSTNHLVAVSGDEATCDSAYRIVRTDPARVDGVRHLVTEGRYQHGLVRTPGGWRISRIRQTVVWQDGDPTVHGAFKPPEASGD